MSPRNTLNLYTCVVSKVHNAKEEYDIIRITPLENIYSLRSKNVKKQNRGEIPYYFVSITDCHGWT